MAAEYSAEEAPACSSACGALLAATLAAGIAASATFRSSRAGDTISLVEHADEDEQNYGCSTDFQRMRNSVISGSVMLALRWLRSRLALDV